MNNKFSEGIKKVPGSKGRAFGGGQKAVNMVKMFSDFGGLVVKTGENEK